MSNFYQTWLGFWDRAQEEKRRAKRVASEEPYSLLRCAPGVRMNFAHHFALERFPYLRFTPEGIKEMRDAEAVSRFGS